VLIELLSDSKVLKILVVGPDLYRVASFFKVLSPLFELFDDGKHLGIVDLIVSLDQIECPSQGVPGIVIVRLLGENCFSSNARAVSFESRQEFVVKEH
jgi:hypothetical protein